MAPGDGILEQVSKKIKALTFLVGGGRVLAYVLLLCSTSSSMLVNFAF